MIKIGLIGEDKTDTDAIMHLLKKKYSTGFRYITLSLYKRGSQLFTDSAAKSYNFEIKKSNPHYVIVIADADAIITEKTKIRDKEALYERLAKTLNCKSILLLNIYELEALLLADIDSFNSHYQTKVAYTGSVAHKVDPKGFLKQKTAKKYQENECPELFKKLNFDTVVSKCSYFKSFITAFEKAVNTN